MALKRTSGRKCPPFVFINGKTLWSEEWRQLLPSRQIIYHYLKSRYNGQNNGKIYFPYSDFEDQSDKRTFYESLDELEARGWISRVRKGGKRRFHYLYRLTGKHDGIDQPYKPFAGLERSVLSIPAWKELSFRARSEYLLMKCNYKGYDNGGFSLPYSRLKGTRAPATTSKSRKELIAKDWLRVVKEGGLHAEPTLYELTRRYDRWPSGPSLVYGKYT